LSTATHVSSNGLRVVRQVRSRRNSTVCEQPGDPLLLRNRPLAERVAPDLMGTRARSSLTDFALFGGGLRMRLTRTVASGLALLLGLLGTMTPASSIRVPHTQPAVMIDGVLSPNEWTDAEEVAVSGVATLYFQQSSDFVYIAVQYGNSSSGIVDLYLSPAEGEVYNLHASAKLGERKLEAKGYPNWVWWKNRDWTANVSRVDSFEKRTFLPTKVREFQIRRNRFPATTWRLRFELTVINANSEPQATTVFPSGTGEKSTSGWLILDLR